MRHSWLWKTSSDNLDRSTQHLQLQTFVQKLFPFLQILFFQPILFYIIPVEESCMHGFVERNVSFPRTKQVTMTQARTQTWRAQSVVKHSNDEVTNTYMPFNKLTSVLYASVLLLIMNFVITLSK